MADRPSISGNPILTRLRQLLHAAINVPESLPQSRRGQARLLAGLLIALLVPLILGQITVVGIAIFTPSLLTRGSVEVVGGAILLILVAYWLNRRGRYFPAATLAVATPAIGVWVLVFTSRDSFTGVSYAILYVLVSVLLAGILLPPWATTLLSSFHLLGLLITPALLPHVEIRFVTNTVGLVTFISLFTVIVSVIRQRDANRLEQQSRQLTESEARYRHIFETAQEGIWILDALGRTTYVNNRMAVMLGYVEPEMLGHFVYEYVDSAPATEFESKFAELRAGKAGHFDVRLCRKDGTELWAIIAAQPMIDEDGKYTGALGLITDITERKRAEEALRESEGRFELVTRATRDVIWDWDMKTGDIWWSDGLELTFKYPPGVQQYNNDWWYAALHPDDLEKVVSSVKAVIARGDEFWSKEYRFRRADGTYADVFDRGYVLYDEQQKPKRFIGAMSDITARKLAEAAMLESEARFKGAFDNAAVGMALITLDGAWLQANQAVYDLLGYSKDELFVKNLHEFAYDETDETGLSEEQELLAGSIRSYHTERRYRHKDGRQVWVLLGKSLVRDYINRPLYFIYQLEDITGRKEAEQAVLAANERLAHTVSELEERNREMAQLNELGNVLQACLTLEEATAVLDQSLRYLFPNESGALYTIAESRNLVEVLTTWGDRSPDLDVFILRDCWALRRGRPYLVTDPSTEPVCDHLSELPTGPYFCIPMMAQNEIMGLLHLQSGRLPGGNSGFTTTKQQLAQTVADSVALALANLRLRSMAQQQSIRDPLTGLFNRRYLEETLGRELARAMRARQSVGFIMMDVDHFKNFNDTMGHDAGDLLLRELGLFLQQHSREGDIVCRYGGEEFILILPGTSLPATHQRADLLRVKARHLQLKHNDRALGRITLSLGVAMYPEHGSTPEVVIRAADAALYRAKNEGRNRVAVADTTTVTTS